MATVNDPPPDSSEKEPTATVAGGKREAFIPLRKDDLGATLARTKTLSTEDAEAFGRFCRLLHVLIHCQLQATLEDLKAAYAPFDPDADTREGVALAHERVDELRGTLFDRFGRLLERANFHRLAEEEINQALNVRSHWGLLLSVDFSLFDRLELYYRGDRIGTRYRRRWKNRFRSEAIDVPIYQRLVIIFRLNPGQKNSKLLNTRDVYMKLFKDIPKLDLDMLLPGSQVKMSLLDRARVMVPTFSGLGIAVYKLFILGVAAFGTSLAFFGLIGGTLGYGVRSLYGYLNTRQKYQLNLTQSLYYQNIDNNAGVIHRLLDEAAEQENREVMLAYFVLWHFATPGGLTDVELDQRVESWLLKEAEQHVDFEIHDALDKLQRLGIARKQGDKWQAVPISEALAALANRWTSLPAAWH